jgi:enoyl-CoA hydratase/carnithine racemase
MMQRTDPEPSGIVGYERDGPLAVLTMTHEPYNLVGPVLLDALFAELDRARAEGARAVVVRSGLRQFCAGADLGLFAARANGTGSNATADGDDRATVRPADVVRRLETFPLPLVASVHGVCLGGGFELALAMDLIVAARSARIGSVESTLGMHPLMGAVQRIAQRAGAQRAKEMAMLGRRYDPDTLHVWGLVNLVVEDEALDEATRTLGLELANGPTVAHQATKALTHVAVNEGVRAADEAMADLQKDIWASADLAEGLRSFRKNGPGLARFEGR